MKIIIIAVGVVVTIALVAYAGLQVKPRTQPLAGRTAGEVATTELPPDLPPPVRRHFEQVFEGPVPLVESAVVRGAPRARINGLWMRMRHTTTYTPGTYSREMDVPWFGLAILRGTERYQDGRGVQVLAGKETSGPEMDQSACLGAWAEGIVMPSQYVTHPGVRWEAVDEQTAHLFVPCGGGEERFTVTFDADTGLIRSMWALRYRGPGTEKVGWRLELLEWQPVEGMLVPSLGTATWDDEGSAWLYWTFDDLVYNLDVASGQT